MSRDAEMSASMWVLQAGLQQRASWEREAQNLGKEAVCDEGHSSDWLLEVFGLHLQPIILRIASDVGCKTIALLQY